MIYFSCKNLSLQNQHKKLFSKISFSIKSGDYLNIYGNNGSGKTSLLNYILSFNYQSSLINTNLKRHQVGLSGHFSFGIQEFTVMENINYLENLGLVSLQSPDVEFCKTSLKKFLNNKFCLLSMGQKKLTSIMFDFLINYKLWLLDEPFANVDSSFKSLVLDLMEKHTNRGGMIIFTSHQPDFDNSVKLM